MGTPEYADAILKKLIKTDNIEVISVYTQPDKPVGRKKILTPPPVKVRAEKNAIAVYQPNRLRDEAAIASVVSQKCDYIVVAAYGQILPKAILEHAPCINLHASILPKYRGASPIQQALLNGDDKTGVTAMLMDEGLDTGDILKIQECMIAPDETAPKLYAKLSEIAADLSVEVINDFDTLTPIPQEDAQASYCKKITKQEGLVTFEDAQTLYNKYRAFIPWPGIYLKSGLKLKEIKLYEKEGKHKRGEILQIGKETIVGCSKGSLQITKVQPSSKKEMDILAYINGKRLQVGDTLY